MLFLLLDLLLAWLLDRWIGDPRWLPHPVNLIGRLISLLDRGWHPGPSASPPHARLAGLALCLVTVGLSGSLVFGLLALAWAIHPVVFHVLNTYLLFAALAGRCLEVEAKKVADALSAGAADLTPAREALSMLVSRDTSRLDAPAIARATVETVAENTVDGVLSPLFWSFVGLAAALAAGLAGGLAASSGAWFPLGASLAWAFKAASTLDSRVGYKTGRYLWFGRASARLDDGLNWLPARLSLFLLTAAACFCRLDARSAWRLGWRDRLKHASPNSAHAEAAMAGALGVALGGPAVYQGKPEEKPFLGESLRPIGPADIGRACRLMHAASALLLALVLAILGPGLLAGAP